MRTILIVVNEEANVVNRTLRVSNWFEVIGPVEYLQDVEELNLRPDQT